MPPAPFDLLLHSATVLTGDEAGTVLVDASIGVAGGRIVHLAAGRPAAERAAERTVDLSGHVVTPGFVNVHTHANLTMVRGVAEDLGFAPAYTKGILQGHMVTREEAVALARLGALGSGPIDQSQKMTAAASVIAAKKTVGHRS